MKILQNAGDFRVLATWPSPETNENAQTVLEKAGRTCYQSEKHPITAESAAKFCNNLLKRTHYSIFEHGWRGYIISNPFDNPNDLLKLVLSHFWPITKFMFITKREDGTILVSANLEAWRKCFKKKLILSYFSKILEDLIDFVPIVFSNDNYPIDNYCTVLDIVPITSLDQLENDEEVLNHVSHTIQYNQHSRGFTHELVRHRIAVYSQESTRYVDEKDFEYIAPPHRNKEEFNFKTILASISNSYRLLRDSSRNWRPEDARQILPTAITAQIVMSCNLKSQRYMLFRRTSEFVHWEIRRTMIKVLEDYFKVEFPKLFEMFQYSDELANDKIKGYCKFLEPASFFCDDI